MVVHEQQREPLAGGAPTKREATSLRVTWPASWGVTLLAVWLIVTGIVILLAPANAVLVALNAIVAIAAGILLFLGK